MRLFSILAVAVVSALTSSTAALGYSFGEWASDHVYSPGDALPSEVRAWLSSIDTLNGIGEFDWSTTPTTYLLLSFNEITSIEAGAFDGLANLTELRLDGNQISSIEAGDFDGMANLTTLNLRSNQISSIEAGDFDGLTNLASLELGSNQISGVEAGSFNTLSNLTTLWLADNQISSIEASAFSGLANLESLNLSDNVTLIELNLSEADFSSLREFRVAGNESIISVSLKDAVVNPTSIAALFSRIFGIGQLDGITKLDLSGIDFADITDLSPLYAMDNLTELRLVNTHNMNSFALDRLLDNLATIEGADTEGILYVSPADFVAFNYTSGGLLTSWDAEPGHHVAIVPEPNTLRLGAIAAVRLLQRKMLRGARIQT